MEEGEYRNTYHSVNQQRCLFEKSILSRRAACAKAHRFCLADREGVSCTDSNAQSGCRIVLDSMRSKALFALQLPKLEGPLPHAKEMKVQLGGLTGIKLALGENISDEQTVEDIYQTISSAIIKFYDVESLPYDEIARSIGKFQGRKRSRSVNK